MSKLKRALKASRPVRGKNIKPLRVLGLDPSLRNFGYVLLDENGKVIEQDTLKNKPRAKGEVRSKSADFNMAIEKILYKATTLSYCKDHRTIIVREDYAYSAHSSSDTILKELGGVLEWEMSKGLKDDNHLHWLPITSVKKWACGLGNATKEQVEAGVKEHFGFEGDEHQCDAMAVATLALELAIPGTFDKVSSKQREALDALKEHPLTLCLS